RDEIEQRVVEWCAARDSADVIEAFDRAEAAIGLVMDMADIADDPHYAERNAVVDVAGTPMQGLIARLSATPGALRWPGRPLDADGDDVRSTRWQ
ncbi:MAG: CoA transferase, partial [Actinomycetota bacterium]